MLDKILKNTVKLGAFTYTEKIIGFLTFLLLTKYLTPEDFGIFAFVMVFFNFLILPKISLEYSYIHSKEDNILKNIETHFFLQLAYFLIALALTSISLLFFRNFIDKRVATVFFLFTIFMFFQSFSSSFRVFLEKQIKFNKVLIVNFIATVVSSAMAIFLASKGFGVYTLILGGNINSFIFVFINFLGLILFAPFPIRFLSFDKQILKYFIKYAFFVILGELAVILMFQADKYFTGIFLGLAILGLYERSYKLMSFPTELVTDIVSRVLFPVYSSIKEDREKLSYTFSNITSLITRIAFLFITILFFIIDDLVRGFFGARWLPMVNIVRMLSFYAIARCIFVHIYIYFISTGKAKFQSLICWIQALLLLIFAPICIKLLGVKGIVLAVTITIYTGIIISLFNIHKTLVLNFKKILISPSIAIILASICLFSIPSFHHYDSYVINMVIEISVISLVFAVIFMLIDRREIKLALSLFRKKD